MKYLLLALLFIPATPVDFDCDNKCRARRTRCEQRCSEDHEVGSMDHLKCNERCRENYLHCRKEDC